MTTDYCRPKSRPSKQWFASVCFYMDPIAQWFPNCGARTSSGTRRPSRWYTNRPTFCFSAQKDIFTAIIFTCRVMLINSWIFVWPTSLLGSKNGHNTFSQPFSSWCICVNYSFPNLWSNDIWHIDFSWYAIRKSLGTTGIAIRSIL